jgi:class 3 adenylate cyclase/tetratricopeptide (TPR) repeat protein
MRGRPYTPSVAVTCPSCGSSNTDDARFCSACGTSLAVAAEPIEERRVVSILFADLAGFTSRSDRADPEDVRRTLVPFHLLAKEEIERFGGTLDKFIGDAAMGVFGAPIAHEDDPERALRAAFAVQARAEELQLAVRVAVNTGEAVVTFATGPQVGENVAGDVVNTASRLQSIAPVGGIVAGEPTYHATRGSIDYRELDSVAVKGKSDLLRVWLAVAPRSDAPDRAEDDPPPFVGREHERSVLRGLLASVTESRSVLLATIVGEPGIGKTRLVADLAEHIRSAGTDVTWWRGRCLPYGEAVTFAPLEEIVCGAAGIGRDDHGDDVAAKLERTVRALVEDDDDADWLRARLSPLAGVADDPGQSAVDRPETFAAWSRFVELEAAARPLVMVVEDLHWADPAMLDFLDLLTDALTESPVLLLCTARPELFDRRGGWGHGKPNASTISLAPLDPDDMRDLLSDLLVRTFLPAETQNPLIASAGGNPLYALEFVRMLGDHGIEGPMAGVPFRPDRIPIPDSVHALIAARLDALSPRHRSLLQDAAVAGDPFRSGAVAAMAPADADVPAFLRELQRRGLIRRTAGRLTGDEIEYSFSHGLVRDVAYRQIPRAGRARRHVQVIRWLEATTGERPEDRAEALAYHATRALDLAGDAHLMDEFPGLEDDARRFLLLAGDRQLALDVAQAAASYRRALELTPVGHPDRPLVLRKATEAGWRSGQLDVDDAVRAYEEARDLALASGNEQEAAHAMRRLYFQLGFRGDSEAAREMLEQGIQLLEGHEPTPLLAELYASLAEDEMFAGRSEASLRWANRALELPHQDSAAIMTLHIRGNGRLELGDLGGMDDLWEALRMAEAGGVALNIATSYSYLSEWVGLTEGPDRGLDLNRASVEVCELRGITGQAMWGRAESMWLLFDAGRWDDLIDQAELLLPWAREHGDAIVESTGLSYRTRVLTHRGLQDGWDELLDRALPVARQIGDLQIQSPVFVAAALVEQARGNGEEAVARIREFDEATADGPAEYRELQAPEVLRIAVDLGQVELAERILGDRPVFTARTQNAVLSGRALVAEARGEQEDAQRLFEEAAAAWATYGGRFERAHALAGQARCLERLGSEDEAKRLGAEASSIFGELGMPR